MANRIPIKQHSPEPGLAEFQAGDTIPIEHGGTGQATAPLALNALGGASQTALTLHTANAGKHIVLSIINGETIPTFQEPVRAKQLSMSMDKLLWAEAKVNNNEWFQVAHAVDTLSGYVMPFNGTVVGYTAHCENVDGNSKPLRLYVNDTEEATIGTLTGNNDVQLRDVTLDIDFNQEDKIRLRGGSGGTILDTVVTLYIRWRA